MDLEQKFRIIQDRFRQLDEETKKLHGKPFFDTAHGIWGASSLLDIYDLFLKIKLDERKALVDLGSGDGRVSMVAALFTKSLGIEGDAKLSAIASRIKNELLHEIPELSRCHLKCADYTAEDLSEFEILFTFADHVWDMSFEEKLQNTCNGYLLSYNNIFLPQKLKKGKTYWVQQLPIISYPLNTDEPLL
jgi:hypothetical protein